MTTDTDDVERLIAEAEAALEGATEGPWTSRQVKGYCIDYIETQVGSFHIAEVSGLPNDFEANARFIAHARQAVPALIAALRAMQAKKREMALEVLSAHGEASEAYTAQLDAEARLAEVEKAFSTYSILLSETETQLLEERATVATLTAQVEAMRGALVDHNDLLRSAMQIAKREGVEGQIASTNWDAYYNRVAVVLKRHHETANAARAALTTEKTNG